MFPVSTSMVLKSFMGLYKRSFLAHHLCCNLEKVKIFIGGVLFCWTRKERRILVLGHFRIRKQNQVDSICWTLMRFSDYSTWKIERKWLEIFNRKHSLLDSNQIDLDIFCLYWEVLEGCVKRKILSWFRTERAKLTEKKKRCKNGVLTEKRYKTLRGT